MTKLKQPIFHKYPPWGSHVISFIYFFSKNTYFVIISQQLMLFECAVLKLSSLLAKMGSELLWRCTAWLLRVVILFQLAIRTITAEATVKTIENPIVYRGDKLIEINFAKMIVHGPLWFWNYSELLFEMH